MNQNWGLQLKCWKCGGPTIVYFLRYETGKDVALLKVRCPRHGERAIKFPTPYINEWLPIVKDHILFCYKCGAPATLFKSKMKGPWRIFKLSCPIHREKLPIYQISNSIYEELWNEGEPKSTSITTPTPAAAPTPKPAASTVPAVPSEPTSRIEALPPSPETKEVARDITVKRQFEHIGGLLRIKAKVVNDSTDVITEVRLRFDIPQKPYRLIKIEPEYKTEGATVFINIVQPDTSKTVNYTLEPLVCGKDKIHGNVQYLDAKGEPQVIQINPLEVNVVCPLFFTEEDANVAKLNNLLQTRLNVRDSRSYLIPKKLAPEKAYSIIKTVISKHDLKLVSEDVNEEPGSYSADCWFFGKTKVTKSDFVITGNVSEENGYMKIVVACEKEEQLIGLLSEIGKTLRDTIITTKAVKSEAELKSLRCPSCSGPIDNPPTKKEATFCPFCGTQIKLQDLKA